MNQNKIPFGTLPDGTLVEQISLRSGDIACQILTYGAALQSLTVPDACGNPTDVVLGFSSLKDYLEQPCCLGAIMGRCANRIGGAQFSLNGQKYVLCANDGANHLHGGAVGFDKQVWSVEELSESAVTLCLTSPDGQEGYPGTLHIRVTYQLKNNALELTYEASSDKDTLCNPTNHTYFNLSGHDSGPAYEQQIRIFADRYTPVGDGSIPTGELADVTGTPMDLRDFALIAGRMDLDFSQLHRTEGSFDHNWVINGWDTTLCPAAAARSLSSGISMTVETTLPGVQFCIGKHLNQITAAGKDGADYGGWQGFCLEPQYFPDSPNHPQFPEAWLRAGETYRQKTVYRFDRLNLSACRFQADPSATVLKGKKINFLGDSITAGVGTSHVRKHFVSLIAEATGAVCRNYGVGGTRIAKQKSVSEWPCWDLDFNMRSAEMDPDADYMVIFGGSNDFGTGDAPFGTFADRTIDTFCGALHTLYTTLISRYPGAKFLIITPLHRINDDCPKENEASHPILKDYVDMIRKTAEYYSLPVLDLYVASGLQPNVPAIQESFIPDGVHPNDAGHEIMATKILHALCNL